MAFLALAYLALSFAVLGATPRSSPRQRRLLPPLALNALLSNGLFALICIFPKSIAWLSARTRVPEDLTALIAIVAVYSLCVEIPGFLLNSAYDDALLDRLSSLQETILLATADPDKEIARARKFIETYPRALREVRLDALLGHCISRFEQMRNVDDALARTLLDRLDFARATVAERSKHPFPRAVEVIGLGSCAFLLAEILAILRSAL